MKTKIYLATFSDNAIELIRENGIGIEFNQFCISRNLDDSRINTVIGDMRNQMRQTGASSSDQCIVHGPYTELCPMGIDPLAVDLCTKRFNQAYYGMKRLGLNRMVLHTGYYPTIYFSSWHIEHSSEFWKEFLYDKASDFTLYIENVFDPDPHDLVRIIRNAGDRRLKICFDIGHANVLSCSKYSIEEWIKIMSDYIGHFHMHNNNGVSDQHAPLENGTMNIPNIFDIISNYCDPDVTFTIESRDCSSSIQLVKSLA